MIAGAARQASQVKSSQVKSSQEKWVQINFATVTISIDSSARETARENAELPHGCGASPIDIPVDLFVAMSNELPLLASAYYSLFCTFHDWYEAALGEQEPPGLVMRPVRSADEEWPHGALLPAVNCLLRSRRARIERVRSMRRRHMLYTSHGTMLPCSSSHLSCLAQGRRSLAEWGFYCRLAHGVLLEATTELERARLVHGLREWQRTAKFITAREAYVTIWGVLSLPRRLFQWWSLCAAMNARKEGQALSYALSWASSARPSASPGPR